MAVPSRDKQIAKVVEFLDAPPEASLTEIATAIIDGIYKMWEVDFVDPSPQLILGQKFKVPWSSSIHIVSWMGPAKLKRNGEIRSTVWVTDAGANFGTLTPFMSPMWDLVKWSTSAGPAKPNELGIKVGDGLMHGQGMHHYDVIAVAEKCVLMAEKKDPMRLHVDSNKVIDKWYTRESR